MLLKSPVAAMSHTARKVKHRRQGFFNLLTGDALSEQVEILLPSHRERLFPPTETLAIFCAQALNADRSSQHVPLLWFD